MKTIFNWMAKIGGFFSFFYILQSIFIAGYEFYFNHLKPNCETLKEPLSIIQNINSSFIDTLNFENNCGMNINAWQTAIVKDRKYTDVLSPLELLIPSLVTESSKLGTLWIDTEREFRNLIKICLNEGSSKKEFSIQKDSFQEHINELDELLRRTYKQCLDS